MTLRAVGAYPKNYFNSDVLLHMKIRMLNQNLNIEVLLWNFVGRPFDIARSNYVVTDCHNELVQMIIAFELADLRISDYSCTFDDSYSLLKSNVAD